MGCTVNNNIVIFPLESWVCAKANRYSIVAKRRAERLLHLLILSISTPMHSKGDLPDIAVWLALSRILLWIGDLVRRQPCSTTGI